jgi:O-methyltransferase
MRIVRDGGRVELNRAADDGAVLQDLYLDLLKRMLTRVDFLERYQPIDPLRGSWKRAAYVAHLPVRHLLGRGGIELVRRYEVDRETRALGRDHPPEAETAIGLSRLENLQELIVDLLRRGTPGDLLEAGVWRGGAAIFMRGVLKAYGDEERVVWLADSFRGFKRPDDQLYAEDEGDPFWRNPHLEVSLEEVQENFRRYGLLDDQVRFISGWFDETLPTAPVERVGLLRLDADTYEATTETLEALYPKVEPGGYVVVDDYGGGAPGCARAVDDYRRRHSIEEDLVRIDWNGAYWQRSG